MDANLELQDAGSQLLLAPVSSIYVDHPLQIAENKCNRVKTDLKPSKVKRKPVLRKDSDNKQSQKTVHFQRDSTSNNQTENTASNCNHQSGQELCYLCHQRQRRNIPISFEEERVCFTSLLRQTFICVLLATGIGLNNDSSGEQITY